MAPRRNRQVPFRGWFADFGQYIVLVIVAAITIFLVVLAFNRPMVTPAGSSVRTPVTVNSQQETPSPAPSATPTVAFLGDSCTSGDGTPSVDARWSTLSSAKGSFEVNADVAGTGYGAVGATAGARP